MFIVAEAWLIENIVECKGDFYANGNTRQTGLIENIVECKEVTGQKGEGTLSID